MKMDSAAIVRRAVPLSRAMRRNIVIVDTGSGNFRSVAATLSRFSPRVSLSAAPEAVVGVPSHLVIPGVGSFDSCMAQLIESGWEARLKWAFNSSSIPILGICVGLQVMAHSSEESQHSARGLDIFPGMVRSLLSSDQRHIQNVGWDEVLFADSALGFSAGDQVDFYFDHGYAMPPQGPCVAATSGTNERFGAVLQRGVAYGVQFHPERSGGAGMALLESFVGITDG